MQMKPLHLDVNEQHEGIVQSGILATGVVSLEKPFTREILLRTVRQVLDEPPLWPPHCGRMHGTILGKCL